MGKPESNLELQLIIFFTACHILMESIFPKFCLHLHLISFNLLPLQLRIRRSPFDHKTQSIQFSTLYHPNKHTLLVFLFGTRRRLLH